VTPDSKVTTLLFVGMLLAGVSGCDDDDTDLSAREASTQQAAAIIAAIMPHALDFSDEALRLADAAVTTSPVAALSSAADCSPVPGVETEFLCSNPYAGIGCATESPVREWTFTGCRDGDRTLHGTAGVRAGQTTTLFVEFGFDLAVDGTRGTGGMTVEVGACGAYRYWQTSFRESGFTLTLDGELGCGAFPNPQVDAHVSASGFLPFLAILTVNGGAVLIGSDDSPDFVCSFYTATRTATCQPFAQASRR